MSKKKHDKSMITGFADGGAENINLFNVGNKYRQAEMDINGMRCVVKKIPSSSHLDDAGLKRKARDMARRFVKHDTNVLVW